MYQVGLVEAAKKRWLFSLNFEAPPIVVTSRWLAADFKVPAASPLDAQLSFRFKPIAVASNDSYFLLILAIATNPCSGIFALHAHGVDRMFSSALRAVKVKHCLLVTSLKLSVFAPEPSSSLLSFGRRWLLWLLVSPWAFLFHP